MFENTVYWIGFGVGIVAGIGIGWTVGWMTSAFAGSSKSRSG